MKKDGERPGSMAHQVYLRLSEKLNIGGKKHLDKRNNPEMVKNSIYSYKTFSTYVEHGANFAKWAKETHGVRTIDEAKKYVSEYLENQVSRGLSAYTVKLEAAALAKLYGVSSRDFGVETPARHRADITRSRGEAVRDKHFSEEHHKDLVEFCRSTGLRRKELERLTGNKLIERDGRLYVYVENGKGGKEREAPVIHNPDLVRELCERAGSDRVFPKVTGNADIHGYRREYASELYGMYARDPRELPREERYMCRKDQAGVWYDREALRVVSEALGHNRVDVVAEHYIR